MKVNALSKAFPRVLRFLQEVSIGRKLLVLGVASATVSALLAGAVLFAFQLVNLRKQFQYEVETVAKLVASFASAPVEFGDVEAGLEVLSRLEANAAIDGALLVLPDSSVFARYGRNPAAVAEGQAGTAFTGWRLRITQPVQQDKARVATLVIGASFQPVFRESLSGFLFSLGAITAVGGAASILSTLALRRLITEPMRRLAELARRLADERDDALQASVEGRDEVGVLMSLLARIEAGDRELRSAYSKLEDETSRRERLHDDLLKASRLAGMAEVATGVLHNVGNVLNTVNLAVCEIQERLTQARLGHLRQAVTLLASQNGNLGSFMDHDPRGRALPGFLVKLADHFETENARLQDESVKLVQHVEHIKEIVSTQQSYARVMGVIERTTVTDLVDSAAKLCRESVTKHAVDLTWEVEPDLPVALVDRHKVVQILVNLVSNAKDSVKEARREGRRVRLVARRDGAETVHISVTDNGVGIDPALMPQLFQHGFTTKANGHGFGLHMSALAAREMGGSLEAQSDGSGCGAVFTLKLPLTGNDEK